MINSEDNVGYKKPPKSGQFQKGKSGNPSGRPKVLKGVNAMFFEHMHGQQSYMENGEKKYLSRVELVFHLIHQQAIKGNQSMLELYLELSGIAEADYINSCNDMVGGIDNPLQPAFVEERGPRPVKPASEYIFDPVEEMRAAMVRENISAAEVLRRTRKFIKQNEEYYEELKKTKKEIAKKNSKKKQKTEKEAP